MLIIGASEFIHLAIQQTFIDSLPFADSVLVHIEGHGKKLIVYLGTLQTFSKKLLVLTKTKAFKLYWGLLEKLREEF